MYCVKCGVELADSEKNVLFAGHRYFIPISRAISPSRPFRRTSASGLRT